MQRQRQAASNLPEHGQIEAVSGEGGLFSCGRPGITLRQRHVASRPIDAVGKAKLQVFGSRIKPASVQRAPEPRRHSLKGQRLQAAPELQGQAFKRDVGHAADNAATRHVKPDAQRATAPVEAPAALVWRHSGMALQRRHVGRNHGQLGPRRFRKHLARPLIEIARPQRQERPREVAAQLDARAPFRRRRGVQPQLMAACRVAQCRVHVGENQRRCAALLVSPAHGGTPNQQLGLREKPVCNFTGVAAFGPRQQHPADINLAIGGAAHRQLGLLQQQLIEAQPPQGRRRQACPQARQPQRRLAGGIKQRDFAQLERRQQTGALGADRADANRHADGLAGAPLECRTKVIETRHNQAMKQRQCHSHQQPCGQHQPKHDAHDRREHTQTPGSEHRCGTGGRLGGKMRRTG